MIFRPTHQRRGEDPNLQTKMLIFAAGAIVALAGIGTGRGWLVWVAVVILAFGVILGLIGRSKRQNRDNPDDDEGAV